MTRNTEAEIKAAIEAIFQPRHEPVVRHTEAEVKASFDALDRLKERYLLGRDEPVVRPARRPPVAARPVEYRYHGNGEWMQLIVGVPFGLLATYITIKVIIFFL